MMASLLLWLSIGIHWWTLVGLEFTVLSLPGPKEFGSYRKMWLTSGSLSQRWTLSLDIVAGQPIGGPQNEKHQY